MKYNPPEIYFWDMEKAVGACVSGEQAVPSSTCLTGVSAKGLACTQGIHPQHSCTSGTLPEDKCVSGSGNEEW